MRYHRQWPSLLKEGMAEGMSDPAQYAWDNVDDARSFSFSRDDYVLAIRRWLNTRSEPVYREILAKVDLANPGFADL